MSVPVKNIMIQGLTVKDSAITFMEPHCMPSVECILYLCIIMMLHYSVDRAEIGPYKEQVRLFWMEQKTWNIYQSIQS